MVALSAVRAVHFAVAIQAIGALLFIWILSHAPEVGGENVVPPVACAPRRCLQLSLFSCRDRMAGATGR